MAQRIQSPNSINTYKQCPRKYFYNYILKLPTVKSIHLIRGSIIHTVLENFFKLDISTINKDHYEFELEIFLQSMFKMQWNKNKGELLNLNLSEQELDFYYKESKEMLQSWFKAFLNRVQLKQNNSLSFPEAFDLLKPVTEVHFLSQEHQVQGYVDAIYDIGGEISLVDYKTSKNDQISEEYKLQLAIYALLYTEKYGESPKYVGIDFLKHGTKYIEVDKDLLDIATKECRIIQEKTKTEDIKDYPMSPGPLCKWSTGQCSFYDMCYGQKKVNDFN